jgi:hypothetical protein
VLSAGRPGFDSWQCNIFLFSTESIPILWFLQPIIRWATAWSDHSPLSGAEIKNGGAIPPLRYTSSRLSAKLINHRDFTLPYSSGYDRFCFLGYNAVKTVKNQPTFRRNMSSRLWSKSKEETSMVAAPLHARSSIDLLFDNDDGDVSLRNVG